MRDALYEQIQKAAKEQERKEALLAQLPKDWTGREIMTTSFPPTRWAVKGLIPTGAILLSGIYKVGKSWLMLQLADCISKGKPFLGNETNQGTVLYLALEDGPARIKRRAQAMGIILAENVHIYNSWLPGNDGLDTLDAWLTKSPARLVTIDTLSRWQDDFHGSDIWARDTKRISDLKAIADLHDCTVLIVHHRSKAIREDIHQSVAGTNALQGAADGSIILDKKRNENTGKLSIVGRDIPEGELVIEFMPETCTWRALDIDPTELTLNADRRMILDVIRELGGTAKPGQIAGRLGKDRSNVSHLLRKLTHEGTIASTGYGTYTIQKPDHSVHTVPTSLIEHNKTMNSVNTVNGIQGVCDE